MDAVVVEGVAMMVVGVGLVAQAFDPMGVVVGMAAAVVD